MPYLLCWAVVVVVAAVVIVVVIVVDAGAAAIFATVCRFKAAYVPFTFLSCLREFFLQMYCRCKEQLF